MIKTFLALTFIFSATICFAQNKSVKHPSRPDSVGYYMLNESTMASGEAAAKFVRLLIKTDSNMFRVNDYYMDGTLKLVAKTTVDSLDFFAGIRGICYEYYPNGKRKSIKNYENGKLVRDAVTYYSQGGLKQIENYSSKGMYFKQYLDSTGKTLAENGQGKWVKTKDGGFKNFMEGSIVDGKEDGPWVRHFKDTVYTIIYKMGQAISGNEYLKVNDNLYKESEVVPRFPGGDNRLNKFLSRTIRYPVEARTRNIQGKVVLRFVVEKDGAVTNIAVIKGIGGGCDEESVRVFSICPKWIPGTIKGEAVRVQYDIPISYALATE